MVPLPTTCQACGQPLVALNPARFMRSDRAFCSDRCKMRAHRAKQKARAEATRRANNRPLRRSRPLFRAPVSFYPAKAELAGLHSDTYYVDPLAWHDTMNDLNRLYALWDTITGFTELQGETSKNSLLEDRSDDEGNDWCAYFESQLAHTLPYLEAQLVAGTPALQTWLVPYQDRIHGWIRAMTEAARFFVYTQHRQKEPFTIHFEKPLITELNQAHRLVVGWWFDYEASIP